MPVIPTRPRLSGPAATVGAMTGGLTYLDPSGWRVIYAGGRTADLVNPDGAAVDAVQVRPWDWERNPSDQAPHTVTAEDLAAALEEWRASVSEDMGGTA